MTPEELNEIEFTVKFRQKKCRGGLSLNYFLHKRVLCLKVGLQAEDLFIAAGEIVMLAFAAFPLFHSPDPVLDHHCFDLVRPIRVFEVICRKIHGLVDLHPITQ